MLDFPVSEFQVEVKSDRHSDPGFRHYSIGACKGLFIQLSAFCAFLGLEKGKKLGWVWNLKL